jgi:hypothetical protein
MKTASNACFRPFGVAGATSPVLLRKVTAFWFIVRSIMRQSRGARANSVLSNVIIFDSKARSGRHSVFKAVFKIITLFSCILSLFPLFLVPRMIIEETVLAMETPPTGNHTLVATLPPAGPGRREWTGNVPYRSCRLTELETGLLPEQLTAQIDYLERQRRQIDAAIATLRKALKRPLK